MELNRLFLKIPIVMSGGYSEKFWRRICNIQLSDNFDE